MSQINNILALIDFSSISKRVIQRAGELAVAYDAKCWLLHIADPDPDFIGYDIGPQYIRNHKAAKLQEEHKQLHQFKKELESGGIACEALLIQGQIHPTIEGEITKLDIDLIVLGSHGHSKLYDLLVGSVCEYLLRHQTVPLVIEPAKE